MQLPALTILVVHLTIAIMPITLPCQSREKQTSERRFLATFTVTIASAAQPIKS